MSAPDQEPPAPDTAPREVTVPPDLAEALGGEAAHRFARVSCGSQPRIVLGVDDATLCPRLCVHLTDTPPGVVRCDVAGLTARGEDLHLLARLALTAGRLGCRLRLEGASLELAGLIELAGLAGPVGLRPGGEPEQGKEAGDVEERVDRDHPIA